MGTVGAAGTHEQPNLRLHDPDKPTAAGQGPERRRQQARPIQGSKLFMLFGAPQKKAPGRLAQGLIFGCGGRI
jgi:hypothetical protein